jgi:hypothetical protein
MGHLERNATCQDCHLEIEESMARSVHRNMACAACHVKILGGYEMTSWGPGLIESRPNPFKKYSLYYGPQGPPILIKDQSGRWIPTKIWPNSVGGIKETVAAKPGLIFRWPGGETHDAYAQLGTFSFSGGNNNYLAWLQVEEVAHPYGKSRTCGSCHDSDSQVSSVTWRYYDSQGAKPFTGSQKIVADRNGLRVQDIRATSKIIPLKGGKTEFYAAWMHLGDIWKTKGDFSIPKADPQKYGKMEKTLQKELKELDNIDHLLRARALKGENVKKLRRQWKDAKAVSIHDPGSAAPVISVLTGTVRP